MTNAPLFFDRHAVADFPDLMSRFPDGEMGSPTRSTVPLLSLFRHGPAVTSAILGHAGLGVEAASHFEFTVPPPAGRGGSSHTDLLYQDGTRTLAVEAKWTEGRYETVTKWLARGRSRSNRLQVLGGWLGLLQPHAARELRPEDFGDCVYQLVHRAASACSDSTAPRFTYLTFHLDGQAGTKTAHNCRGDLQALWERLGGSATLRLHHHGLALRPTPAFAAVANLPKRQPGTADKLRAALLGPPLFDFGELQHHPIGSMPV